MLMEKERKKKKRKHTTPSKKIKMTLQSLKYPSFPDQAYTHARTMYINHHHSSEPFNFVPPSFIPFSFMTNRSKHSKRAYEKNRRINIRLKRKKTRNLNRGATPSQRRKLLPRCKTTKREKSNSLLIG